MVKGSIAAIGVAGDLFGVRHAGEETTGQIIGEASLSGDILGAEGTRSQGEGTQDGLAIGREGGIGGLMEGRGGGEIGGEPMEERGALLSRDNLIRLIGCGSAQGVFGGAEQALIGGAGIGQQEKLDGGGAVTFGEGATTGCVADKKDGAVSGGGDVGQSGEQIGGIGGTSIGVGQLRVGQQGEWHGGHEGREVIEDEQRGVVMLDEGFEHREVAGQDEGTRGVLRGLKLGERVHGEGREEMNVGEVGASGSQARSER